MASGRKRVALLSTHRGCSGLSFILTMSDARSLCVKYFASQPCPECTANGPCSDPLHVAVPSDAPYMRALFRDVLKPCKVHVLPRHADRFPLQHALPRLLMQPVNESQQCIVYCLEQQVGAARSVLLCCSASSVHDCPEGSAGPAPGRARPRSGRALQHRTAQAAAGQ